MDAEGQPAVEPDPVEVLRGDRASHRTAWLIFGSGVFVYVYITLSMLIFARFNRDQILFEPVATLPTDRALALLGLCATMLITLVASLWASGQVADAARSRGRRRALTVVTWATGVGSVVVGICGALHRPTEGWSYFTGPAIFCLCVVFAYITADVAVFILRTDRWNKRCSAMTQRTVAPSFG